MSEAENVTETTREPAASALNTDMTRVLARLTDIDGKLGCLSNFSSRLEDGDRLFKEHTQALHQLQNNMGIVLLGVQRLLLQKATDLELVQSLSDVSGALDRLTRERDERIAALPDDDEKLPATLRPDALRPPEGD